MSPCCRFLLSYGGAGPAQPWLWHHRQVPSPGKDLGRAAPPVAGNLSLPQPLGSGEWIYVVMATGNPRKMCWGGVFIHSENFSHIGTITLLWTRAHLTRTRICHPTASPAQGSSPDSKWEIVPQTHPLPPGRVLTFKFFAPLSLNKNILYISLDERGSRGYFGNGFASWFQIQQRTKGL